MRGTSGPRPCVEPPVLHGYPRMHSSDSLFIDNERLETDESVFGRPSAPSFGSGSSLNVNEATSDTSLRSNRMTNTTM